MVRYLAALLLLAAREKRAPAPAPEAPRHEAHLSVRGQEAPGIPGDWLDAVALTGSIDPDDRERGRAILEKAAGPQKDVLRKMAKEGNEKAALIAGLLGEKETRSALLKILKSDDIPSRRAAAEALGWCGGDSGSADLAAKLDDPDLATAMGAARALARLKKPGIAQLQKALDGAAKNERKAIIAAHGLDLVEPGSMATFIKQRLNSTTLADIIWPVATNSQAVIDSVKMAIDKTAYKRSDEFKVLFEKGELAPVALDALGTFCVRAALLNPADCLAYLKAPHKLSPWAFERIPRIRGMRKSTVAYELVKVLEATAAKKSASEEEEQHAASVEKLLQSFCGSKVPQGASLEDRAKEYREWYDRVWATLIDADVYGAIDDGVAWLKRRQNKDGSWAWCACGYEVFANIHHYVGQTSLCGYTLLKMDVAHDDPAVLKAVNYVLGVEVAQTTDDPTYSLSIETMFLAELVTRAKGKKGDKGTKAGLDAALQGRLLKRIQECVDWLSDARVLEEVGGYESASWTYTKPAAGAKTHDHSNAQFAILGLIAGQNVGAKVALKVWSSAFNHWKKTQYEEGGWYYTPPAENTPKTALVGSTSMTGAGLSSVLVAEAALKKTATEKVAQTQDQAKKAIAKWAKTYPIPAPARYAAQGHVFSVYYDLYSVERSMMLAGLLKIGDKDWYHDGALYILYNQMYDGAWLDTSDTCFALLFLKKAYIPVASGGDK